MIISRTRQGATDVAIKYIEKFINNANYIKWGHAFFNIRNNSLGKKTFVELFYAASTCQ